MMRATYLANKMPAMTKVDMDILLGELNAQQKDVVLSNGNLLVLAGPGAGKTKTIVSKIAYMIYQGYEPSSIVLITFTRRAAREMMERLNKLTPHASKVVSGTIHSFAYSILKQHIPKFGIKPNHIIIDESEADEMMRLVIAGLIESKKIDLGVFNSIIFDLVEDVERADKEEEVANGVISIIAESALEVYTQARQRNKTVYQYAKDYYSSDIAEGFSTICVSYDESKRRNNLIDFTDILVYTRDLLSDKELASHYAKMYKYIVVDEYQDTDNIQFDIVKSFALNGSTIIVVGDEAQSIYSFRGASYGNISRFLDEVPDVEIKYLPINYRSTLDIIHFSNICLGQMRRDARIKEKHIEPRPGLEDAGIVTCIGVDAPYLGREIVMAAQRAIEENKKIGILYRSNSKAAYFIEYCLINAGIEYKKYGGMKITSLKFFRDFIAFMRIAYNPNDYLAWGMVFQKIKGIGDKTADKLIKPIRDGNINPNDILKNALDVLKNKKDAINSVVKVVKFYESNQNINPSSAVYPVYESAFAIYKEICGPVSNKLYGKPFESIERVLLPLGKSMNGRTLDTFFSTLFLFDQDDREDQEKGDLNVILSTVHSSKGLEYDIVYFIELNLYSLPSKYTFKALNENIVMERLEEERRVFYVGITRAKEELHLRFDANRSPSPYLIELFPELANKCSEDDLGFMRTYLPHLGEI